ncbi:hypothetical protein ACFL13_01240 [Patescibacteria group bacterium]
MTSNKTWQEQVQELAIRNAAPYAPEEADYNSAMIQLHEIVPKEEMDRLQNNLAAIEEGRSSSDDHLGYPENDFEEYDDPAWCYACNKDTAFCSCPCSCGSELPSWDCCGG